MSLRACGNRTAALSALAMRQAARNGAVASARRSALTRGAGGGHPAPPFIQQATPAAPLHEQADLLWDDGVAPEMTLDFDAPNFSAAQGLAMWLGGLTFFAGVYNFVKYVTDPPSKRRAVPKVYDEEIMRPALGGYSDPK